MSANWERRDIEVFQQTGYRQMEIRILQAKWIFTECQSCHLGILGERASVCVYAGGGINILEQPLWTSTVPLNGTTRGLSHVNWKQDTRLPPLPNNIEGHIKFYLCPHKGDFSFFVWHLSPRREIRKHLPNEDRQKYEVQCICSWCCSTERPLFEKTSHCSVKCE